MPRAGPDAGGSIDKLRALRERAVAQSGSQPKATPGRAALLLVAGLGAAIGAGLVWATLGSPAGPAGLDSPTGGPAAHTVTAPGESTEMPSAEVGGNSAADARTARASRSTESAVSLTDADWPPIIEGLDDRRSRAFATGEAKLLTQVYALDSPALVVDRRRLADLRGRRVTATGLRLVVRGVRVASAAPDIVVLQVRDEIPAYDLVDEHGAVVEHRPGRGSRSWRITLQPAHAALGEWRISKIEPVTD